MVAAEVTGTPGTIGTAKMMAAAGMIAAAKVIEEVIFLEVIYSRIVTRSYFILNYVCFQISTTTPQPKNLLTLEKN